MSAVATPALLTTRDLLALPEKKGVMRYLIRGQLREIPMTKRNRIHGALTAWIAHLILQWLEQQPGLAGNVYAGEIGCILRHDPDTTFGIDVAYASADVVARQNDSTTLLDGVPTLAVEILSPSDKKEIMDEKIDEYLAAGVPLVWIVDPHRQTVLVLKPGQHPQLFSGDQELSGEPHMPGFRVTVSRIFER
jgi:Uma2 family endonuclease